MTSLNLSGHSAFKIPLRLGVWYSPRVNLSLKRGTSDCTIVLELR